MYVASGRILKRPAKNKTDTCRATVRLGKKAELTFVLFLKNSQKPRLEIMNKERRIPRYIYIYIVHMRRLRLINMAIIPAHRKKSNLEFRGVYIKKC